jgi:hypothetical protein
VYSRSWRLLLADLVAFSHLQFSQIRGRQPHLNVRKIQYVIGKSPGTRFEWGAIAPEALASGAGGTIRQAGRRGAITRSAQIAPVNQSLPDSSQATTSPIRSNLVSEATGVDHSPPAYNPQVSQKADCSFLSPRAVICLFQDCRRPD